MSGGGGSQEASLREEGARLGAIPDVRSNIQAPALLLGRPERDVHKLPKHLDKEESQYAPCRCFRSSMLGAGRDQTPGRREGAQLRFNGESVIQVNIGSKSRMRCALHLADFLCSKQPQYAG